MKAADYVEYDFIPQDTKHFKHQGFCVMDVLLGVYANLPRNKKLTKEWIIEKCGLNKQQDYYEPDDDEINRMHNERDEWYINNDNWQQ